MSLPALQDGTEGNDNRWQFWPIGGTLPYTWSRCEYLLGHESVQTTERYIGCKQRPRNVVND
jgi:hypothetical protein